MQRPSSYFFSFIALGLLLLYLMFADARLGRHLDRVPALQRQEIVRVLGLTDLCLFTEARYTRHPSMADRHAPFQDHPSSLEHFPSGTIVRIPPHLTASSL